MKFATLPEHNCYILSMNGNTYLPPEAGDWCLTPVECSGPLQCYLHRWWWSVCWNHCGPTHSFPDLSPKSVQEEDTYVCMYMYTYRYWQTYNLVSAKINNKEKKTQLSLSYTFWIIWNTVYFSKKRIFINCRSVFLAFQILIFTNLTEPMVHVHIQFGFIL